ncbi:MAG: peptidase S41 [Acidobacteria bacterium]|nr:MAG: peptidase S41 [Acidobacteriota bacterium]
MHPRRPSLAGPAALVLLLSFCPSAAPAVDVHDTRLLAEPAVSAEHVAFVYAGDLWLARRDGSGVHRLTSHPGRESNPRFSPDGRQVAFTARYDGNVDVYLTSVDGGEPRRLTYHPAPDRAGGFTPDGTAVFFTSPRGVHTFRHAKLFTVATGGGFPVELPIPHADDAAWSADGTTIAYTPLGEAFREWKNYRGGTASRIWLYDVASHHVEEIPRPPERSNDHNPMWLGGRVYFLSDRAGEFNLFRYDPATAAVEQLTHHDDFPILAASAGPDVVIYEQAGYLHLYDPARGNSERLTIGVGADLRETRPRYRSGARFVRSAAPSPSGARAVFEFRGEIVTLPAEKGDPRNLTNTPGVHERSPVWSPDGSRIAYFSDASGEYALHVAPQDGRGETRIYPIAGNGFYEDPKFSPDGRKISFTDNGWSLYWLDLDGGELTLIDSEPVYGPVKTQHHSWSPDSRWLVYTKITDTYFRQIHLYDLESRTSHPLTEGLADAGEPVFDAGGKYLYFSASTDAGPVRSWFAMSNADMEMTSNLYLAVLAADEPSPLAKESDEEKPASDGAKAAGGGAQAGGAKPGATGDGGAEADGDAEGVEPLRIDLEGLAQRIVALPLDEAYYSGLAAAAGKLYYVKSGGAGLFGNLSGSSSLATFDLAKREETVLMEGATGFRLAAGGKKILVQAGQRWYLADAGKPIDRSQKSLAVDAIQVRIEPRAEWRQMFEEAWRINRDYFYDPGMHGADWPAMRARYEPFLDHLATRDDLNRVLQWLGSELAVGHHRVGGGDFLDPVERVPGGLLGADYEIAGGRYRFARVYGGLNWNPELRAPLTEPGVGVVAGDYLLAVGGRELRPPENLYARFENTAGKIVELTVGPDPGGAGSRTVQVVPIESEIALRNRAWVEDNLRRVDEATGGRVAYVYVPDTSRRGHTYFKRYFFPQANKQAIIVDERHNGGGQVADYYIDALRRPQIAYWAMRYGKDLRTPLSSIQGPKVMLIDETAGSGGDLLPWMFRKLGLGPLIGKTTWGGLVGILGFPVLMDGGRVTAPNLAIWTEDGWVVENAGVPPDIEVEQWPEEVVAGRDPQLEKAIEVVLEMLEADPPKTPERPPYPVRVRR